MKIKNIKKFTETNFKHFYIYQEKKYALTWLKQNIDSNETDKKWYKHKKFNYHCENKLTEHNNK